MIQYTESEVTRLKQHHDGAIESRGTLRAGKMRYRWTRKKGGDEPDDFVCRIYVPVSPTQRPYWRRVRGRRVNADMTTEADLRTHQALGRLDKDGPWVVATRVVTIAEGRWVVHAVLVDGSCRKYERDLPRNKADRLVFLVRQAGGGINPERWTVAA